MDKEFSIAKVSGRIYKDAIFQKLLPRPEEKPEKNPRKKPSPAWIYQR